MSVSCGGWRESYLITKVLTIHQLGTMGIWTQFHGMVDMLTSIAFLRATTAQA